MSWVAVGVGAMLGAWLRWGLQQWLNTLHFHVGLGTLVANLGGGFMIGMALAAVKFNPAFTLEWRLFFITGFLGGLTTFSAFSAEAMILLQRGDYLWALGHSALHVIGSIAFCIVGFAAYRAVAG
jgi:CrcB protein